MLTRLLRALGLAVEKPAMPIVELPTQAMIEGQFLAQKLAGITPEQLLAIEAADRKLKGILSEPYWGTPQMLVQGVPIPSPVADSGLEYIVEPLQYKNNGALKRSGFWVVEDDKEYPVLVPLKRA